MALPSFLIIGAQKAATTTLWAQLRTHPDVFMPELKETNFFIQHRYEQLGQDWYEDLFSPAAPGQLLGEASPAYTLFPIWGRVPDRIAGVVPDAKLVYVLRDPIERMRSSWIQARSDGLELRPLDEAFRHNLLYLAGSSYAMQLEQFLRHFSLDQVLLLTSEAIEKEPGTALDQLLLFLGLDPGWRPEIEERHNVSAGKRVLRKRGDLVARGLAKAHLGTAAAKVRLAAHARGALDVFSRPLDPEELVIGEELRERVARALAPDLRQLASIMGLATDPWGVLDSL